ncbi:MAG: WD40 repeat domain-containing protein [Gemmataceae bacterium]
MSIRPWVPWGVFSPDGGKVALLCFRTNPPEESVFDVATGKPWFKVAGHTRQVTDLAFSPDGTRLVSASGDNTARVWDVATGRLVATFAKHTRPIGTAVFAPDGRRALTLCGINYEPGVVGRVWEVETGREVVRLDPGAGQQASFASARFSADGRRILTDRIGSNVRGGKNPIGDVCVWDAATGKLLLAVAPDPRTRGEAFRCAALSQDGIIIACGAEDGAIRLFDAARGAWLDELRGHTKAVRSLAFHSDGKTLLSASEDGTARLWDLTQASERERWWNEVDSLAVSPDAAWIAFHRFEAWFVTLLDARANRTRTLATPGLSASALGFSPDSRRVLTAAQGHLILWDPATGRRQAVVGEPFRNFVVEVAAISPDGARAFLRAQTRPGQLWDLTAGKPVAGFEGNTDSGCTVRFTADGTRLLAMSCRLEPPLQNNNNSPPALLDAATGRLIAKLEDDRRNQIDAVRSISGDTAFGVLSPDGSLVLTCSSNGLASLWDAATGQRRVQMRGHLDSARWGAFSPDGRQVATAGDNVRLWDAASGRQVRQYGGHEGKVRIVAFSPDGTRLASAGEDKTARVVEGATGKLLGVVPLPGDGHRPFVALLDNDTLLTWAGGTMRLWPVDALAEAKRRRPRAFTAAERAKYEINP